MGTLIVNRDFITRNDTYNISLGGNLGNSFSGLKQSADWIEKRVSKRRGAKASEEAKRNQSLAHMGQKAWNKNIPCREETKKRISQSKTGKKQSEAVAEVSRKNAAKARLLIKKGYKLSIETRLKIGYSNTIKQYIPIKARIYDKNHCLLRVEDYIQITHFRNKYGISETKYDSARFYCKKKEKALKIILNSKEYAIIEKYKKEI